MNKEIHTEEHIEQPEFSSGQEKAKFDKTDSAEVVKELSDERLETADVKKSADISDLKNEALKDKDVEKIDDEKLKFFDKIEEDIDKQATEIGSKNTWNDFKSDPNIIKKYSSIDEIKNAYEDIIKNESPWINGEAPEIQTLPIGTRFEMAMAPGQPDERPGGFGTFDNVSDKEFVRIKLAVKTDWKPDIDRINTYEITAPLPGRVGPVGPQIDLSSDKYLSGGASQVELCVNPRNRMDYLRLVDSRKVDQDDSKS